MNKTKHIDMCNGPLFMKLLQYAVPLMLTGILQLLYNAADVIVVGKFADDNALAAVTSTGSLVNLLVNVFVGITVGVVASVSRHYGAADKEKLHSSVHTAMTVSIICGAVVTILGLVLSEPLLVLMGSPPEVLPEAVAYLQMYFLGMPAFMVYNFGASILRAVGDTRRPLIFLLISGAINVVLNLWFVISFQMRAVGVGAATAISQYVSAVLVVICLLKERSDIQLNPKELHINKQRLFEFLNIGLPAGIQSSIFSISNVLIQSSINSFGAAVIAGNGAAGNIEGFIYVAMNSFYQAVLTFSGQNFGAKKPKRIMRSLWYCLLLVMLTGILLSLLLLPFQEFFLGIYTDTPETIAAGKIRLQVIATTYFLCGMMEVMCGVMRGMGYSTVPMITSLLGACGLRILWLYTVFQWSHDLPTLYLSYPVSWAITFIAHFVCFHLVKKRLFKPIET